MSDIVPDVPLHQKLALTPSQIEALTGISARHIRDCVKEGTVRKIPHTTRIVIARAEVDRWLASSDGGAA